jgi:hypothetical protein
MTRYYYSETNANSEVIATDGNEVFCCYVNPDGTDVNTGILVAVTHDDMPAVAEQLRVAYAEIDCLDNMEDIKRDFPDDVYPFDGYYYENLILIAEVED